MEYQAKYSRLLMHALAAEALPGLEAFLDAAVQAAFVRRFSGMAGSHFSPAVVFSGVLCSVSGVGKTLKRS